MNLKKVYQNQIEKAWQDILRAKKIVIAGHINPDGDSIGSLLALGLGLKKTGKNIEMISADGVPERYRLLPGAKLVKKHTKLIPDLAISVDCSNKEILGDSFKTFVKAGKILEIDHHEFRRPFGDAVMIDHQAAAVGEQIYLLLKKMKIEIDKAIAQNIITSIAVETNSFRLPGVTPFTFKVCSELLSKNIDYHKLVETVYWSKTKAGMMLTGICISRCRFLKKEKVAWSIVTKKDFDRIKGKDEDVDAVADELRAIKNVKIAILFREGHKGKLRVSLRSKGNINVASIAERYAGGGHFDVAGCTIPYKKRAIKQVLGMAEKLV